jgi:hypothetical protein
MSLKKQGVEKTLCRQACPILLPLPEASKSLPSLVT